MKKRTTTAKADKPFVNYNIYHVCAALLAVPNSSWYSSIPRWMRTYAGRFYGHQFRYDATYLLCLANFLNAAALWH